MGHPHISTSGDVGRINLPTRFDVMSSHEFRIPFVRLLNNTSTRKLVADFSSVDYIDSTGIGTLISWEKICSETGKTLVLDKCGKHVVKVFKLSGVERLFAYS